MRTTNAKCGLRTTILVLLAAALCYGTIGCGSKSTSTAGPTPTPSPTPTPGPTANITTIAPNSATAGGLAFTLTVSGSNFLPASQVQWNGNSRTTTFVSSTQLQAHIMAADLAAAGKVPVTVLNPAPGGGTSNTATFTVPAATIAFRSVRALDGSDALDTTSVQNIWVMNPDGSGAMPLTRLTTFSPTGSGNPVWSPDGSKIAFESSRALDGSDAENTNRTSNIWVMNADGSNPRPLTRITAARGASNQPAWSRDGSKIAFQSARALDGSDAANPTLNLWVMNADGSGATPLTRLRATYAGTLSAFSPDGSKVVFGSERALDGSDVPNTNRTVNLWVINVDGSGETPLTRLTALNSHSGFPTFSPDGSKIAFTSRRALDGSDADNLNNTQNIWVINADGSGATPVTRLTASGADCFYNEWSPDGGKIAFASARAFDGSDAVATIFTSNIWTVHADGSSPTPVTKLRTSQASSFSPKWSPDGNKVIFVSVRALDGSDAINANLTPNIWVVQADGSGATPLTRLINAWNDSPDTP